MNYLLDTCTLLWFIDDNFRLSNRAKSIIESPDSLIYLSLACIWELAIKSGSGKLELVEPPFSRFVTEELGAYRFKYLQIEFSHLLQVAELPSHHRDPFDRLIIAQSLVENIPIITTDEKFDDYQVRRVW